MEQQQEFTYDSHRYRFGYAILPIVYMLSVALILALALALAALHVLGIELPNVAFDLTPVSCIMLPLVLVGMLFLGMGIHVSHPSIIVYDDGFRLKTSIYKSKRFSWKDIESVESLNIPKFRNTFVLRVTGLSSYFLVAGYNTLSGGRAFFISNKISDMAVLMAVIRAKRPDLGIRDLDVGISPNSQTS